MAKAKNLNVEIIKLDEFERFVGYMPNPDELLGEPGRSIPVYREMKLDGKIDSLLNLRKDMVTSFSWHLEQGESSDQVYSFVKDNLPGRLHWERDLRELLSAIEYGYSVSEVIWEQRGGYWIPRHLKSRRAERFRFNTDGTPILASSGTVLDQPYKLLIYRNSPEAENPYGTPILSRCYWMWKFKQAGLEFWLSATEKAGVPSIIALFESMDERRAAEKAQEISLALTDVSSGSGAALANVKEIKTLEMSGVLKDFQVLINTCNAEMSYSITGQSLATQEAEFGTRAQATVHQDTLYNLCRGDAVSLAHTMQDLIDWMVELNFGADVPAPRGGFDLSNRATFEEVMNAIERGVPVSRRLLYDRYGLPEPSDEEDAFIGQSSGGAGAGSISLSDSLDGDGKKKLRLI